MKQLPTELTSALAKYMKDTASYTYTMDRITEYIEQKNLNNETAKIKMIMGDLRLAKSYLEQKRWTQALDQYNFVKNTLLHIN